MSEKTSTKIGHGLAKGLGIKLDYRNPTSAPQATPGDSTYSVHSADPYLEEEPHAIEWVRSIIPGPRDIGRYFLSLFPFLSWIHRYNSQWLLGDMIAGITIGAVVVPQGMSYAKLALLPVQYGLYSSFMGVSIYWFFATSKDITIGPVAVMSKLMGEIVTHVWDQDPTCFVDSKGDTSGTCFPPQILARATAIIVGGIVCGIGLLRLGWLVEFIPLVAICAFMTGSALNIAVGQVPNLLGESVNASFNTRAQTYKVIIETLKNLHYARIDAALGLTALFALYLWRWTCNYMARKQPQRQRLWFIIGTLRTAIVLLFYVMVSACSLLSYPRTSDGASDIESDGHWAVLGPVPRGFQDAGVPRVNNNIIGKISSYLPAAVIVLLIEHISIAKSFGRVNNYTINPSQELVAIGVTNLLAPFVGGYPSTGSFSRTAIKSKAGVRTPLAGVITAIVVLLAIYALPAVFFYIPSAALAAVIIHAVGDLITPPNVVYQFWRVSPLEVPIFFAGVLTIVFTTIEYGVYVVITTSLALMLWRQFKARGAFLGTVTVNSVIGDQFVAGQDGHPAGKKLESAGLAERTLFLPIERTDGSNPDISPEQPYPGIFIYRLSEGYNYLSCNHYMDQFVSYVKAQTQKTNPNSYKRPGDRPWNDPGPRKGHEVEANDTRPTLKAIIMDFGAVNLTDVTSVQLLIDVRNQFDRWADPDRVQWHFANIKSRWTKRALASAGFGYATPQGDPHFHRWKPIFNIAEIRHAAEAAEVEENKRRDTLRTAEEGKTAHTEDDSINGSDDSNGINRELSASKAYNVNSRVAPVTGLNRPYFHTDLMSALQAAIRNTESLRVIAAPQHHGVAEDNPVTIMPPEKAAGGPLNEKNPATGT